MGLDMTLRGVETVSTPWERDKREHLGGFMKLESTTAVELDYWRKHWGLHEEVTHFFGDKYNCIGGEKVELGNSYGDGKLEEFILHLLDGCDTLKNPYPDADDPERMNEKYAIQFRKAVEWMNCLGGHGVYDTKVNKNRIHRSLEYCSSW